MAGYRKLKAWQHAQRLAVECARESHRFPSTEQTDLAPRLRRAAYDVPLHLAAGTVRGAANAERSSLDAARAALAEVETALTIARDLGYIEMVRYARLEALADETSKMLFGLRRRLVPGGGGRETHETGTGATTA